MPYIIFLLFWWVINCQTAAQSLYDKRGESKYGYTPVRKGQLWGVLDSTNRIVAACQYKNAQVVTFGCDITGLLLDGDYCFIGKDSLRCYQQLYGYENGYARASKNGLQGYVDKNGIEIVPCEYRDISYIPPIRRYILTKPNNKIGFMALNPARIVIPAIYDGQLDDDLSAYHNREIPYPNITHLYLKKDGNMGIIDTNGNIIVPFKYKEFIFLSNSKIIVTQDSAKQLLKLGICDLQCQILAPVGTYNTSKSALSSQKYGFLVAQKDDKYGMINRNIEIIVPFKYDTLYWMDKITLLAKLNNKYGLIDSIGKSIIPIEYDSIYHEPYINSYLFLKKNNQYGIINSNYETIFPCEYEEVKILSSEFITVKRNGQYQLFSMRQKKILPFVGSQILIADKGILIKNKRWGFLQNNEITWLPKSEKYDTIERLSMTLLWMVAKKNKNGTITKAIINNLGEELLPFSEKIQSISRGPLQNTITIGKKNKKGEWKYGEANLSGYMMIKPQYEKIENYKNLFFIWKNTKKGLIDKDNNLLIPPIYDSISVKKNRPRAKCYYYLVYQNNKVGILDTNFRFIAPIVYDSIEIIDKDAELFTYGQVVFVQNEKKGVLNKQGKELIPPILIYDQIIPRKDGYYDVKKNGKWGLLSREGKLITSVSSDDYIKRKGNLFLKTRKYFLTKEDSIAVTSNRNLDGQIYIPNMQQVFDTTDNFLREYKIVYNMRNGIAMVKKGDKIGVMDKDGREIFPFILDNVNGDVELYEYPFHIVSQKDKWGLLDAYANWVFEPKYIQLLPGHLSGKIDTNLQVLLYSVGTSIDLCERQDIFPGKWGVISTKGKVLTPPIYRHIKGFDKSYSEVTVVGDSDNVMYKGELHGLIDTTGRTIIQPIYKEIILDVPRLVKVTTIDNKQGLFDLEGNLFVPCRFEKIYCNMNYCILSTNDSVYVINYKGEKLAELLQNSYNYKTFSILDDVVVIREYKKMTVYHLKTHQKYVFSLSHSYTILSYNSKNPFFIASYKGDKGTIDTNGKEIVPCKYNTIAIDKKRKHILATNFNTTDVYTYKGKKIRTIRDKKLF